ncbi:MULTISPECIES: TRAP transporter small permease subunit [Oligella]|uniref:TRAP transporter small permease protein n=1 Tax=Oligella urethralis TaxID=90245 RepID=A0A2X1UJI1_9BURK|nr:MULTISPECIES: TRAP transporter small permease subunit [Oligella]MDK6202451.1 TRAP transporter small permease subunit [Oligella urethralis]OFS89455.1 C4-dicarboxylate ABC transporter permease [Oligella sp. HMSC05A10]OFV48675.1 C4-dicarboxylate ABC transporter permease [Oligella sp. HMSC09E12]SPY07366.1 TRAP-type mannitol/chloroaromatic compound transport system, small permease component [Oligella urethralis]SUA64630.1 TRAP-type mannitol/chloroaromatic compound transport system, small permeas
MIIRIIDVINEVIGKIVSFIAIIFAVIIIYEVFMRYALHQPTRWSFDVTKQLYGFYFMMLGAYALKHQAHVRVDLLVQHLSRRAQKWVDIAGYLIFFFPFSWIFLTRSYEFAMRSVAQAETTYGAVQLPIYPLKISMVVAAALLLLQGVAEVLRLLFKKDV